HKGKNTTASAALTFLCTTIAQFLRSPRRKLSSAPTGRNMTAQGSALGPENRFRRQALKGRNNEKSGCCAPSGLRNPAELVLGRCPRLSCCAPLGQVSRPWNPSSVWLQPKAALAPLCLCGECFPV